MSIMRAPDQSTPRRPAAKALPQSRTEFQSWVQDHLQLSFEEESALMAAVESVVARRERLWQESKQDAIRALMTGFAEKMTRVKRELSAREATVNSISRYFEQLVAELTDRSHRDPKTKLMNFGRFTEQLEAFLALEQRGRWSAVGLVDITGFKWYNDTLGHATGDRIIEQVAHLLREQVRSDDIVTQERVNRQSPDLHARFGGDEFCFLIPDLVEANQAYAIAERFREAVDRYDWRTEDPRLAEQPVHVDVGVVCLRLGRVGERRFIAGRLALALVSCADKLMYAAKSEHASHINLVTVRIEQGELVQTAGEDGDAQDRPDRRAQPAPA